MGCSGSTSAGSPSSRSVSLVVGPTDATTTLLQSLADLLSQLALLGHLQHVDNLLGGREQDDFAAALGNRSDIGDQRPQVLGQFPAVDRHVDHPRTAGFQAGDQAGIGLAVFLQAHGLVGQRHMLIECGQQLAPRVGFGDSPRGCQADLLHRRSRLRTAGDGHDVRQAIEKTPAVDMPLDGGQQHAETDARQKHHDADIPRDQPVGEIDGSRVVFDRDFPQRRADVRHAPVLGDQPGHFLRLTAFEGRHTQSRKVLGGHCRHPYAPCFGGPFVRAEGPTRGP